MKVANLIITAILVTVLLFPAITSGHGGEEIMFTGKPLLIPFTDKSPIIDGNAEPTVYPETGHFELPNGLGEVKLSHNDSYLFVAAEYKTLGLFGIGIQSPESHDEADHAQNEHAESLFTFIFVDVVNGTFNMTMVSTDQDLEIPFTQVNEFSVIGSGKETTNSTMIEFAIKIESNDGHEQLLETGASFATVLTVSNNDILPVSNPDLVGPIQTIALREGDNPEVILEILEDKPNWMQALVIPLVLVISAAFLTWKYWPKAGTS